MENDPVREWQRMQERYAQMNEDELQFAADKAYELTDIAKEVLEAEIKTRRLPIELQQISPADIEEVPWGDAEFDPSSVELAEVRTSWDEADARIAKGILDEAGVP